MSLDNKKLAKENIHLNEFPKALQYHQTGQLHKAEEIYKKILRVNPGHSDSLHLLGVIALQAGKIDVAIDLINKAIQHNPGTQTYYNNLGNAFKYQGNLTEAISSYQKAVEIKPDYAEAYYNLGNTFKDQGNLIKAISSYQKALQIKPDYPKAHYNLGTILKDQGKPNEAISCFQKALEIKPDFVEVYNNMGNALKDQDKLDEAILSYQKAIEIKPDHAIAHFNLGNTFKDQGRLNEATSSYQKALQFKPDFAEAHYSLGNAFKDQGKLNEAISCFQKALEIKPDFVEVYNNMGNALKDQGKLNEAGLSYQKAIEFNPDYAAAYYNLGNVFKEQGNIVEAISSYQKALEIGPELAEAHNELFHQLQQTCSWQNLKGMTAKLDDLTMEALDNRTRPAETPFVSLARHISPSRNLAIAKSWSDDIERAISGPKGSFSHDARKSCKTKISIGYLSNDFRNHPQAHLILSMFGLHDRDKFNIFCYSYGNDDSSYYRTRIRQDCDKFVDLHNLSHIDAAKCIYEDQVDILVDLKGYTRGSRIEILVLRPAPVQVRYLGLAGTMGASFLDYIITDRIITPENHARYYSENFVYLPHGYQVNDNTQEISNKDWKKADFGLPETGFVFCSFNKGYKIEPVMFNTWMNILRQVPESILWLQRINEAAERNLKEEASVRGVESARLVFADKLPKHEHLARLKLVDVALDTRIVNGAVTTSDALWVGVPVITLQGNNFSSRMSSSILTAIGLPELITQTAEEYESLAIDLARNPDRLHAIKQKITKNLLTQPLFDTPGFTRNLENAYKEMWEIFVAGESPRQINVVED